MIENNKKREKVTTIDGLARLIDKSFQTNQDYFDKRLDVKFEEVKKDINRVENRLDEVENRLDGVENKLDNLQEKVTSLDTKLTNFVENYESTDLGDRVEKIETVLNMPQG